MGWKIFLHAFRIIFRNHKVALKLCLPMLLVLMLISVLATPDGGVDSLINALLIVGLIVATIWATIGWMRYVLLEEPPSSLNMTVQLIRVWQFFWRFALLFFMMSALSLVLALPLLVVGFLPDAESITRALFWVFATAAFWAFVRVSPFLTVVALGGKIRMSEAWNMTRPFALTLAVVTVLNSVFSSLFAEVTNVLFGRLPFIWEPVEFALACFGILLSASLLAVIHGVCVEGRNIN